MSGAELKQGLRYMTDFGEKYVRLNDTPDFALLKPKHDPEGLILDRYLEYQNHLLGQLAVCEGMIEWLIEQQGDDVA